MARLHREVIFLFPVNFLLGQDFCIAATAPYAFATILLFCSLLNNWIILSQAEASTLASTLSQKLSSDTWDISCSLLSLKAFQFLSFVPQRVWLCSVSVVSMTSSSRVGLTSFHVACGYFCPSKRRVWYLTSYYYKAKSMYHRHLCTECIRMLT